MANLSFSRKYYQWYQFIVLFSISCLFINHVLGNPEPINEEQQQQQQQYFRVGPSIGTGPNSALLLGKSVRTGDSSYQARDAAVSSLSSVSSSRRPKASSKFVSAVSPEVVYGNIIPPKIKKEPMIEMDLNQDALNSIAAIVSVFLKKNLKDLLVNTSIPDTWKSIAWEIRHLVIPKLTFDDNVIVKTSTAVDHNLIITIRNLEFDATTTMGLGLKSHPNRKLWADVDLKIKGYSCHIKVKMGQRDPIVITDITGIEFFGSPGVNTLRFKRIKRVQNFLSIFSLDPEGFLGSKLNQLTNEAVRLVLQSIATESIPRVIGWLSESFALSDLIQIPLIGYSIGLGVKVKQLAIRNGNMLLGCDFTAKTTPAVKTEN